MKVLIIDGQETDHSLIGDILTSRGCNLLEVTSGREALRVAHKEAPDIAIADLLTPSFDRSEFVSRLRKDPLTARMPVIFYTDGYLEIASGLARDVDSLLTPMLLCEEAIRGHVIALENGAVVLADKEKKAESTLENVQDVFTFACPVGGERTDIRPADLIADVVGEARKTFPKGVEITSAYSHELWLIEGDRRQLCDDDRRRPLRVRYVSDDRCGSAPRPRGIRQAGRDAGGCASHADRDGAGRQVPAGLDL